MEIVVAIVLCNDGANQTCAQVLLATISAPGEFAEGFSILKEVVANYKKTSVYMFIGPVFSGHGGQH
eukprot:2262240-Lingulodinium_polyedra.AAC.1